MACRLQAAGFFGEKKLFLVAAKYVIVRWLARYILLNREICLRVVVQILCLEYL